MYVHTCQILALQSDRIWASCGGIYSHYIVNLTSVQVEKSQPKKQTREGGVKTPPKSIQSQRCHDAISNSFKSIAPLKSPCPNTAAPSPLADYYKDKNQVIRKLPNFSYIQKTQMPLPTQMRPNIRIYCPAVRHGCGEPRTRQAPPARQRLDDRAGSACLAPGEAAHKTSPAEEPEEADESDERKNGRREQEELEEGGSPCGWGVLNHTS